MEFYEACDQAYRASQMLDKDVLVIKDGEKYITLTEEEAYLRDAPGAELTFARTQSMYSAVDAARAYHAKYIVIIKA